MLNSTHLERWADLLANYAGGVVVMKRGTATVSRDELATAVSSDLKTAQGAFTQINADGSISTGKLYTSRPGRMRFEYDPPEQALVLGCWMPQCSPHHRFQLLDKIKF